MKDNKNYGSGGLGLASVLTIVFIILKLVGVINWSWWWVLSPLWINAIFVVLVLAVVFVVVVATDKKKERKERRNKWKR